ncbi:hypothetical protein QJS10_CPB11g00967 [Acorus calamus]|uniref:Secreted protein n=1 Tax=Acorus calamus TaxID=4465 RepID=A0AAV9DNH3_ACOCL|nr:hypothetical protein QJS10_CPB11g00967 [Acorus calamus]
MRLTISWDKLLSLFIAHALLRAVPVVTSSGAAYIRPFHRILSSLDASFTRSLSLLHCCMSRPSMPSPGPSPSSPPPSPIQMGVSDPAESAMALAEVAVLGSRNRDLVVEEGFRSSLTNRRHPRP